MHAFLCREAVIDVDTVDIRFSMQQFNLERIVQCFL